VTPDAPPPSPGRLAVVGVSAAAESAYAAVLTRPGATTADLADFTGTPARRLRLLLHTLEAAGLIRQTTDRPHRYHPLPPGPAIDALILAHRRQLHGVLLAVPYLQQLIPAPARDATDSLEVLAAPSAVTAYLKALHESAEQEILLVARPDDPLASLCAARERGVTIHALIDHVALSAPGGADRLERMLHAGIDTRVLAATPTTLLLVDHRTALIPLDTRRPNSGALLVRAPALLATFMLFFEAMWQPATPVYSLTELPTLDGQRTTVPVPADQVIALLAAGLSDQAIAEQLNVSLRTLDRRIHTLLLTLTAQTRFQAGWRAAQPRYLSNNGPTI